MITVYRIVSGDVIVCFISRESFFVVFFFYNPAAVGLKMLTLGLKMMMLMMLMIMRRKREWVGFFFFFNYSLQAYMRRWMQKDEMM